ncbi:MAG: NAD-dependent epimerase/dehydratase family protein [Bacteroidetes bacterium]|jgi:UDP-N-acetylglucosamine 4-epimerase|nr:NAD-dependent epimerase/dehydratase family protein [Bacteroidota bacterium]
MNLLITGGAGFIGSNLAEHFLDHPQVDLVRVLDDLSNGYIENVNRLEDRAGYEFIKGDIRDYNTCLKAMKGIDRVSHQAALGSVPRSIKDPMATNAVNVGGTVNILHAAQASGIDRVVLAFSSSTYGDSKELPKVEDRIGAPLSPYAVSKVAAEQYAHVFKLTYGLDYVGLRYFNIFGPHQNPNNPYAAVIPIFCKAFIKGDQPTINGDGTYSRDFTNIANAIQANELALITDHSDALNEVYNVACGDQISLNEMVSYLQKISKKNIQPTHGPVRPGDVPHSKADISKIREKLGYQPRVRFYEGLEEVYHWYQSEMEAGRYLD